MNRSLKSELQHKAKQVSDIEKENQTLKIVASSDADRVMLEAA